MFTGERVGLIIGCFPEVWFKFTFVSPVLFQSVGLYDCIFVCFEFEYRSLSVASPFFM